MQVHPYADRFPMLPADELQALADDIKASGQIHPITLWRDPETGEELLIDGRNRRAACAMVRIEPKSETFEGDPYAFIRSANNRRRQMSAGQQAAADAFALFDQGLRINGRWKRGAISGTGDMQRMAEAGVILDEDPGLLQKVLAGSITLPAAYDDVNKKRVERAEEELQRTTIADGAHDLLGMITEGNLTLSEAWAAYQERTRKERERQEAIELSVRTVNLDLAEAVYRLAEYDHQRILREMIPRHAEIVESGIRITQQRIGAAIQFLTQLQEVIK